MSAAEDKSVHPGGLRVRRGAFTAVVLRDNAPAGALWPDPDGGWRAAPGAWAVRAVSGNPDDELSDPAAAPIMRQSLISGKRQPHPPLSLEIQVGTEHQPRRQRLAV